MSRCVSRRSQIALAIFAACSSVSLSWAQTSEPATPAASGVSLDEIVVTATRREERLQDVAVSVTAFTPEKMDAQGLRSIDDLTRLSPGVVFQRDGAGGAGTNYNDEDSDISIRGIDSAAGTSTVGIYLDDTPIQTRHLGFGSVNPFPALTDLDRVEVLRGPQGTLFGAGSEGGTIRFITPQPGLTHDTGYARAEVATTKNGAPSYETSAALGGPIIDDVLGFRVSASLRRDGGYVDRVSYTRANSDPLTPPTFNGDIERNANWQQTESFRAALKWVINDAISITPSVYHQELHINDTGAIWSNLSNPSAGVFRNGNARTDPSTDPLWLSAIKVDSNLGFAQLTSNTAYYSRNQHSISDFTQFLREIFLGNSYPAPGDAASVFYNNTQKNFYQEVRLTSADPTARLSWNGGVFYARLNENAASLGFDPTLDAETGGELCARIACPNGLFLSDLTNRIIDKQVAAFGELSFKPTDTLKATAGLRVARVQYTGTIIQSGAFLGVENRVTEGSAAEHPVTPKAVLSWQPDRDELFYISAAKGYRVGGVNADVGKGCAGDLSAIGEPIGADGLRHVPRDYASDSLWSYEIGAKNTLLDRRLQINASLFIIDWRNIQQNVYLPTCGNQFVANLGRVRSQGGEIEVNFRPVQSLLLNLTVAYTDAKFAETSCAGSLAFDGTACVGTLQGTSLSAPPVVSKGDRLLGAPWSTFTSAEYSFPEFRQYTPYIRLDFQYATAQTALLSTQDPHNAIFDTTVPSLPTTRNLSLRTGLRWNGFDLSLFGQNLTNAAPVLFKSRDNSSDPTDVLYFERSIRPLTVGATATYRF